VDDWGSVGEGVGNPSCGSAHLNPTQPRSQPHDTPSVRDIAAALGEGDVDVIHNAYRRARREFRGFLREVVARHTGASQEHLDSECRRVTEMLGS
jgi:hypothetical protein